MCATREKLNVAATWGFRKFVEPSYKPYEAAWLRDKIRRQLLAHVIELANERISLDNVGYLRSMYLTT